MIFVALSMCVHVTKCHLWRAKRIVTTKKPLTHDEGLFEIQLKIVFIFSPVPFQLLFDFPIPSLLQLDYTIEA